MVLALVALVDAIDELAANYQTEPAAADAITGVSAAWAIVARLDPAVSRRAVSYSSCHDKAALHGEGSRHDTGASAAEEATGEKGAAP